jgi:hypothetical protein
MNGIRAIQKPVANTPDAYAAPTARRARSLGVPRSAARFALLALTSGCIVALAVLKAGGDGSHVTSDLLGGVLAVAFIALALIDFRLSVAVTIFELVLGGAGGHWLDYGPFSGRLFLIAVVTLRAAWLMVVDWRRGLHPLLGRYGAHALAIAFLIPAVWMPLGLLSGNLRGDVFSDGNGLFFFAFVLVVVTLVRSGDGAWFLRLFFAACAASAAIYFLLIVVTASGAVSLDTVREWLSVRLAMGGVIGHMPNGAYRLFTGGSLLLVVGAALTTQRLLARPRAVWLWLLAGIVCVDLVATYTRGLWLAALIGVALVLALDVRSVRQLGLAVAVPTAIAGLALLVAPAAGFSLYGYVTDRAATIVTTSDTRYPTRVANPSFEASRSSWRATDAGGRSMRALRTDSSAWAGAHSLQVSNSRGDEDAFVFQNLAVKAHRKYSVSAWVNARALRQPAAGGRGLLVWDAQDGLLHTVPLTSKTNGWRRLSATFRTKAHAKDIQIRLYAPKGRVLWDAVRLARGTLKPNSLAGGGPVQVSKTPGTPAAASMALASTGGHESDAAGAASNSYKIAEAKALFHYIRRRPIYGYGFGSTATDFSPTGYSYELSYLDLLFKTGILGLLIFLSFPVRLVVDALSLRSRDVQPMSAAVGGIGSAGAVVGVIAGILVAGSTNPYLFAAFGLVSILAMVAWLELAQPVGSSPRPPD